MERASIVRLQGAYYIVSGAFPFVSRRAFEAVTGPKKDWWLVQMVGLLAITNGLALSASTSRDEISPEALSLSILSAASFAFIDTVYALKRRISPVYLCDAAVELAMIAAVLR
jgi:hypothetical protein